MVRFRIRFVNETREIEREYVGPDEALTQHQSSRLGSDDSTVRESEGHCPEVVHERDTIFSGDQNDQLSIPVGDRLSQRGTEAIIGTNRPASSSRPLQYLHPNPPPIPDPPIYTSRNNISLINVSGEAHAESHEHIPRQEVLAWPINDHTKAGLLSSYFQHTSRWCEVTNSLQPLSALSSHLVLESQAFTAAAVAISSITVTRRDRFSVLLADELYAFARKTLRRLKSKHCRGSLVAITLLYMYCSALGKTIEGQSTRDECAELLLVNSLDDAPDSVSTACFWAFARQDVWAAYFSGWSTTIPTAAWKVTIPPGLHHVPIQDTYSNIAIWITARIVNELSRQSAGGNEITLRNLWAELQAWVIERPISVRCVMELEGSGDLVFPTILFSNPSAVCGNLYYHTGCILLLATGKIPDKSTAMEFQLQITTINSIHMLRVAARYIPTAVEKVTVLKHLKEIEDSTGWKTGSTFQYSHLTVLRPTFSTTTPSFIFHAEYANLKIIPFYISSSTNQLKMRTEAQTSSSSPSKATQWDPISALGIINPDRGTFTCVGNAQSVGRRCRNPIRESNREFVNVRLFLIASMGRRHPAYATSLEEAAHRSLCWRHGSQAPTIAKAWNTKMDALHLAILEAEDKMKKPNGSTEKKKKKAQSTTSSDARCSDGHLVTEQREKGRRNEREQARRILLEACRTIQEEKQRVIEKEKQDEERKEQQRKREKERQDEEKREQQRKRDQEKRDEEKREQQRKREKEKRDEEKREQQRKREKDKQDEERKEQQRKRDQEAQDEEKKEQQRKRDQQKRDEEKLQHQQRQDRETHEQRQREAQRQQDREQAANEQREWTQASQNYTSNWTAFQPCKDSSPPPGTSTSTLLEAQALIPWPVKSGRWFGDVGVSEVGEFNRRKACLEMGTEEGMCSRSFWLPSSSLCSSVTRWPSEQHALDGVVGCGGAFFFLFFFFFHMLLPSDFFVFSSSVGRVAGFVAAVLAVHVLAM
ncbi:hypothetical protein V494_00274 [Pseudogymnoascus sp. VKM F-4513 (FW-928)]|nr:hypothetical protein V494_00274 [Pseudogymnoascus sp. VKM F-4513 (FW-928)]